MKTINYKGKEYLMRTFLTRFEDEPSDAQPHLINVSVESLSQAIREDVGENFDNLEQYPEAHKVDSHIYFYVEDDVINKSAEEVVINVDEMVLVEEVL